MERQILQVLEFQNAFEVKMPIQPKMLSRKRARLRQALLEEEVKELREAKNILDVADAICDILYITYGTAHEYGMADRLVMLFDEVHRSNMSKMGPDGNPIFREDGKVLKPETYSEPKLRPILERDFNVYKNSDTMKDAAEIMEAIAKEEKDILNKRIENKLESNLSLFDKIRYWMLNKLESNLRKKVEVKYPQSIYGEVVVNIYGKDYPIQNI
jgi:predicted HAD superfamily Cof-like phosphohydrolase